jgi:bifunctional N-acetylglucosamine-1-phosphate-uridyltransferase/glucosamine-1-phosphate-acetyltransferase GlmU-like protein
MMNKVGVIILAAGQGKRMKSALPKVTHLLGGKPLLLHVLDRAWITSRLYERSARDESTGHRHGAIWN